jgi:predicted DNA-binding transcriptional regulator AlpA
LPKLAFTIKEFVQATGIARTQVFEYIKRRRLKARKSGRRVLILEHVACDVIQDSH